MLPVNYQNELLELPVKIVPNGDGHRFYISIEGNEVVFEKDDGGAFRALVYGGDENKTLAADSGLWQAIIEVLKLISP